MQSDNIIRQFIIIKIRLLALLAMHNESDRRTLYSHTPTTTSTTTTTAATLATTMCHTWNNDTDESVRPSGKNNFK